MSGLVCLQGGAELTRGCRDMDAALLAEAQGPVVVTALAAPVGQDYRTVTGNGVRHLSGLSEHEVLAAPDAREDRAAALAALGAARTVVLPGGSPARLLAALRDTGVAHLLAQLVADGGTVIGSSAGAMVVCGWTVLPEGGHVEVRGGTALLPRLLVVPHWDGSGRADWLQAVEAAVPANVTVLGVPEQSGVTVRDDVLVAVGRTPVTLVRQGRVLAPGETWRLS